MAHKLFSTCSPDGYNASRTYGEYTRDLGTCVFLASVVGSPPFSYRVCTCHIVHSRVPCMYVKLLLHPIIRGYTRKCAANIVEKYERSLVVG